MQGNVQRMRKIWPFSYYFLFFAGVASYHPYLVLYYQSLSFSGTQIGLLVGIAPLITLVSLPVVTRFADRTDKHRQILSLSLLVVILVLVVLPHLKPFILLCGASIVFAVFFSPIMPLSDSATMYMLRDRRDLYGRIRLGGTIGYGIVATVAGSLVEHYGLRIAFWCAAGVLFFAFLAGQKLVHDGEQSKRSLDQGRASELLRNPRFLLFLLLGFSGGMSFSALGIYFFPYMKELGAGESMMGVALTIGTIAEVPVLFFVSHFIKRFEAYPLVLFAIAMTSLRLLLLAVVVDPAVVLFVQLLNGFNYPLLIVASVTYADHHAPKGLRATAQGLFNAAAGGIGSATGGFAGGLLIERIGAKGMYLMISAFLVLVLIFVSLVRRLYLPELEPVLVADVQG